MDSEVFCRLEAPVFRVAYVVTSVVVPESAPALCECASRNPEPKTLSACLPCASVSDENPLGVVISGVISPLNMGFDYGIIVVTLLA